MPTPHAQRAPAARRRERGSISPEEILEGAFRLARTRGLDNLSMPRLASEMEMGVSSIYWYFRSKSELIEAMTADAIRQTNQQLIVDSTLPWDERLLTFMQSFRRAYCNDEVFCDLVLMRTTPFGEEALTEIYPNMELILTSLVDTGFSRRDAVRHYYVLSNYARGCVVVERRLHVSQTLRPVARQAPDPTVYPTLAAGGRSNMTRGTSDAEFDAGLRVIIAGIRASLPSA